jgi:isopenicillin N synthase-like dioxygenase
VVVDLDFVLIIYFTPLGIGRLHQIEKHENMAIHDHRDGISKGLSNGNHSNGSKEDDLTFHDLPPFPDDVPTAPLLRLSLKKLVDGDEEEQQSLWQACCGAGFFYLDLRGGTSSKRDSAHSSTGTDVDGDALLKVVPQLFDLGERLLELPIEEKMKYDRQKKEQDSYFGYKSLGNGIIDKDGTRDEIEWYNTPKDDLMGLGKKYPTPEIIKENRELIGKYMKGSHAVVRLIMASLNQKLGLPDGKLESLHRIDAPSSDIVRIIRSPPQPEMDELKITLGEHTDFGSVTILFNRLGGLMIPQPNGNDGGEWAYVRPLKGHCVVNLGDAMVKFSAGVLRSSLHRVVNPPGEQKGETRMSLVYFSRPEDEVLMQSLDGSRVIDEARERNGIDRGKEEEITAYDWILRRSMNKRAGGDYAASMGSEGDRVKK